MIDVGVTGHRVLSDIDKICAGIDLALAGIQDAYPAEQMALVSSLAEGADRLVVWRALERVTVRLIVPLPLPVAQYMTDFVTAASKEEFHALLGRAHETIALPRASSRVEAYETAGRYVLERCGVLIAVWDGSASQGVVGTGAIVREARKRGLPLAWIHAGNRIPGTMRPTSLGEEQGRVTFENM